MEIVRAASLGARAAWHKARSWQLRCFPRCGVETGVHRAESGGPAQTPERLRRPDEGPRPRAERSHGAARTWTFLFRFGSAAALASVALCLPAACRRAPATLAADPIPYPAAYRRWAHVKTAVIGPASAAFEHTGGIHHIYANDEALGGYRTGRFPDGSILVFELLEAREADGVTSEGTRTRADVMVRDSKRFAPTGGWGFERFLGDGDADRPLGEEQRKACFTCHAQRPEHDLVFSEYRR